MRRIAVLLVLVSLVGCSSPPPPKTVAEVDTLDTFSPDQDVPLVAPDEASSSARPRLTESKRIGGGPDDTSVDGKHRGATTQAQTRARSTTTAGLPRARGYYVRGGGTYASSSNGTSVSNFSAPANGGVPAVGANYPSAPSFGSAAAK